MWVHIVIVHGTEMYDKNVDGTAEKTSILWKSRCPRRSFDKGIGSNSMRMEII